MAEELEREEPVAKRVQHPGAPHQRVDGADDDPHPHLELLAGLLVRPFGRDGAAAVDGDEAALEDVARDDEVADQVGLDRAVGAGAHGVEAARDADEGAHRGLQLLDPLFVAPVEAAPLTDGAAALGDVLQLGAGAADARIGETGAELAHAVAIELGGGVGEDQQLAAGRCRGQVLRRGLAGALGQDDQPHAARRELPDDLVRPVGRVVRSHDHLQFLGRVVERQRARQLVVNRPLFVVGRDDDGHRGLERRAHDGALWASRPRTQAGQRQQQERISRVGPGHGGQ